MADLDQFKSINDAHGHDAGDAVLKKFAEVLQSNTRLRDICGRLGGDEFLLVITHSEEDGVRQAIEHIREQIEAQRFTFGGHEVGITASFGMASLDRGQNLDFERLLARADVALHSAKWRGRNRLQVVPPELHCVKRGIGIGLSFECVDSAQLAEAIQFANPRSSLSNGVFVDLAMFDIFSGAVADKDAVWVEAVSGLANAQRRMQEIAARSPGQYFVFSQESRSVVARIDTRKSTSPSSVGQSESA